MRQTPLNVCDLAIKVVDLCRAFLKISYGAEKITLLNMSSSLYLNFVTSL